MDPSALIVIGIFALISFALIYYGFTVKGKIGVIEATPKTSVRNVTTGLVELHGTAKCHEATLTSPFQNVPCVYYRYKVMQRRSTGKRSHWSTVAEGHSPTPFFLKDDTGEITINPKDAEVHLSTDHTYRTGIFGEGDQEKFQQGLDALGINRRTLFGFKAAMRCEETYIRENEPIFVLGEAEHGSSSGITGSNQSNTVISKGHKKLFMISDKSEKELIGALKIRFLVCVIGGVALLAIPIFYALKFLK